MEWVDVDGDSHTWNMAATAQVGGTGTPPQDTHRELAMAMAVPSGLLALVGVVVKGGAEEAGLYLVALTPHEVGTAGTGPVLHGAPGGDHPVPLCPFV